MEDDQLKKEDDLSSSPSFKDGQQSMGTIQGLLVSHRDEDGHQPPTGTSLTPAEGHHQAGGTHSPAREVDRSDTPQGSGLIPISMGLTAQRGEESKLNSSEGDAHFARSLSSGGCDDTWMSPRPGNIRPVVQTVLVRSQDPGIKTIQYCKKNCVTTAATTPEPSSGQSIQQGSDKSNTIPSINSPDLPDNHLTGDNADNMSISGHGGGGVPVPGDKQEGDTRTDPRRVVEGDAMSGPRRVVNRWSDEDRRKVACVHLQISMARVRVR